MKSKIIKLSYFPFEIMVITTNPYDAEGVNIGVFLKKKLPEDVWGEIEDYDPDINGRTIMFSSGQTLIVLNKTDLSTITHESFHAIDFILSVVGLKLTKDTDEVYAYGVAYLTNEINKFIQKLN